MPKFKKSKETTTEPIQNFERSSKLSRGEIIVNNFLGGIFWGIGSIVGIALFLTLFSLLAQYVNLIPFIGDFIGEILSYLQDKGEFNR
jgi:predicted PurR-regulated permease PerM